MKRWITWMLLAVAAISLVGCGGGSSGSSSAPNPNVRYFNGVNDSTAYDFLLDDDVVSANRAYLETNPDFEQTDNRIRDVAIRKFGTTDIIWVEVFDFVRDKDYLVTALGLENFGSEPLKRARIFRYEIDREAPNGNRARVYCIHGYNRSAGNLTPPIDFQNPGNNPQFALRNVAYGGVTNGLIDATNQTLEVRRTGTESVLISRSFTFAPGKVYAVVALGVEDAPGAAAPRIEIFELSTD